MKWLDKCFDNSNNNFIDFKGEQRERLSSNNVGVRCSPFEFLDTSADNVTEDEILDYLAKIICDMYLKRLNGNTTNKESGDLLPGINERTS